MKDLGALCAAWAASSKGADGSVTIHALSMDELQCVLQRLPNLERYMAVCRLFSLILPPLATSARKLSLPLHRTHAQHVTPSGGLGNLNRCSALRSLDVLAAGAGVDWTPVVVRNAATLENVALAFAATRAPRDTAPLAAALASCPALSRLAFTAAGRCAPTIAPALRVLPLCRGLRELKLLHCNAESVGVLLRGALPSCGALRRFEVAGDDAGGACGIAGEVLWELVLECAHLTHVALSAQWRCGAHCSVRRDPFDGAVCVDIAARHKHALVALRLTLTQSNLDYVGGDKHYDLDGLFAGLERMPSLRDLEIRSRPSAERFVRRNADGRRSEAVVGRAFAPLNVWPALSALPCWPQLRTLRMLLHHAPYVQDPAPPTAPFSDQLTAIAWSSCQQEALLRRCLHRGVAHCVLLDDIGLDGGADALPLGSAAVPPLLGALAARTGLRALALKCRLPPAAAAAVAAALRPLGALARLELNAGGLDEAVAKSMAAALRQCAPVRALSLFCMAEAAAPLLLDALPDMPSLAAVDLSGNDRHVLAPLAAVLPRCGALRELTLRGVHAGAPGPSALAPYTEAPWLTLAAALPACTSLRVLRIGRIDVRPREATDYCDDLDPVSLGAKFMFADLMYAHSTAHNYEYGNLRRMVPALKQAVRRCRVLQSAELAECPSMAAQARAVYVWRFLVLMFGIVFGVVMSPFFMLLFSAILAQRLMGL